MPSSGLFGEIEQLALSPTPLENAEHQQYLSATGIDIPAGNFAGIPANSPAINQFDPALSTTPLPSAANAVSGLTAPSAPGGKTLALTAAQALNPGVMPSVPTSSPPTTGVVPSTSGGKGGGGLAASASVPTLDQMNNP